LCENNRSGKENKMNSELSPTFKDLTTPGDVSPRPFGEVPALWLKILQMNEAFFALEAPRARASSTLIGILILAAATAVAASISALLSGAITTVAEVPPGHWEYSFSLLVNTLLTAGCGGLFGGVISFYVSSGLIYLGALIFGGRGDFNTQTYLQSLFVVPVGIVVAIVSMMYVVPWIGPCLGGVITLAAAVYTLILNVQAVKVAHDLTMGRAVAAIFVPTLVLAAILACLAMAVVFVLALLGPAIGNIFENIVTSI
jgi:hypothetical protein